MKRPVVKWSGTISFRQQPVGERGGNPRRLIKVTSVSSGLNPYHMAINRLEPPRCWIVSSEKIPYHSSDSRTLLDASAPAHPPILLGNSFESLCVRPCPDLARECRGSSATITPGRGREIHRQLASLSWRRSVSWATSQMKARSSRATAVNPTGVGLWALTIAR